MLLCKSNILYGEEIMSENEKDLKNEQNITENASPKRRRKRTTETVEAVDTALASSAQTDSPVQPKSLTTEENPTSSPKKRRKRTTTVETTEPVTAKENLQAESFISEAEALPKKRTRIKKSEPTIFDFAEENAEKTNVEGSVTATFTPEVLPNVSAESVDNSAKEKSDEVKPKRRYNKKPPLPTIPVSIPLEEEEKKEEPILTLKQFKRKQKLELKRQKEKERQLRILLETKEITDTTDEKYSKIEQYSPLAEEGLTTNQVEKRQAEGLTNRIKNKYSKSYTQIIFGNLFTFFNLLCALCIVALALFKDYNITDYFFVVVYVINLFIGIIQEIRSKVTVEKLSLVKAPMSKVIRNGTNVEIPTSDLVLNDVVLLQTGNQIPCDSIILSGEADINESLLTGESVAVKKGAGEKIFAGTYISSGNIAVRVDRIGDDCYVQRLSARAKKFKKSPSQLLNTMNTIIKTVGILIVPVATLMGIVNYSVISKSAEMAGATSFEILKKAVPQTVSVVIGMIPSGMFLLTSMALAVGVIRLAKNHTLVQDMYSLEMLARIDVLCLDKTGTITDGHMNVSSVVQLSPTIMPLRDIVGSMQNSLRDNNMTSIALNEYFDLSSAMSPKKILPFSSDRKYSAVTFIDYGTYVLGAPDFVMKNIPNKIRIIIQQNMMLGARVLMLAHSPQDMTGEKAPASLKPIALIVLNDNVRADAIKTIKWFKDNGVMIKVISGDDPITVSEIAKRAGVDHSEAFINLDGLNNKEVFEIATKYTVFGRVTPEQKAVLVKALKTQGHTVAMTGDGVNDILAMKESDCSITVASGSDATRNIAHLVLMDNNFNSMPLVVKEGRRVINNIQQSSSLYLMKTLFTLIFAMISIVSQVAYPFTTGKMIALEFLVIGMGSFFLSLQPNNNRVKGSFLQKVFSNALPGALILVFNIYALQIITKYIGLDIPTDIKETMEVYLITFGGMVYLYRVCEPMDAYRGILYGSILILSLVWAFCLQDLFDLTKIVIGSKTDDWKYLLIVLCMIQLNFPLLRMFTSLLGKIKITSDDSDL